MVRRPGYARLLLIAAVVLVAGTVGAAALMTDGPFGSPGGLHASPGASDALASADATATPSPTPPPFVVNHPAPGHETFGYVPYWEMTAGIGDHLARTELTTLALFSVTNRTDGTLDARQTGYQRIAGSVGQGLISGAHARGVQVQLVFTSFGLTRNARLFGGPVVTQDQVIAALVEFTAANGMDGIDVDVEQLDGTYVDAYGSFVGRLRTALVARIPHAHLSVATTANDGGAAMALAAAANGADRIVLMGYDYRVAGSAPGATSPIVRADGGQHSLTWSLDLYGSLGVPIDRTLLGLPLYGVAWPVDSGEADANATGPGTTWIPGDHLDVLGDATNPPTLDPVEGVEVYRIPKVDATGMTTWQAIYVDSARTLALKLALTNDRGLAGAGFWAIGYERGIPDITALIARFARGEAP